VGEPLSFQGPPIEAVRLLNGFRGYQMVVAACRLQLPDLLANGPKTADELASLTGTHAPSLRRFMKGLAAWRFVVEEVDGAYAATAISEAFRSNRPGLRNLTLMLNEEGYGDWADLLHSLQTGEPVFERRHGKGRWEALAEDPAAAAQFNAAMVEITERVAGQFVDAYDFDGVGTVVDVAGGSGALLAGVLKRHVQLAGILFDLPAGLGHAPEAIRSAGLTGRVALVEGSFFDAVPGGGDLYMLKSIIHDWDDERAVQILRACRAAMGPAARLVVIERLVPEKIDDPDTALPTVMSDLHMMVELGGRERTTNEYGALFRAAGLRMTRQIAMRSDFYAIEARPG
jgi:hypothetical protein